MCVRVGFANTEVNIRENLALSLQLGEIKRLLWYPSVAYSLLLGASVNG